MKIVFTDESGQSGGYDNETKELTKGSSQYFTLGSFMIDSEELLKLEREIRDIKIRYGLKPTQEIKSSMSYSKLGLTYEKFHNLLADICSVICNYKNSIIAIVIDKKEAYKRNYINNHNDLYAEAMYLLMERVCMNLNDEPEAPVMFFTDSRKNAKNNHLDKELQISYLRAKYKGTRFVNFPSFSESIVFIDSEYCVGIQLADICTAIINRKIEQGDMNYYELIKSAIRTHNDKIDGYGIKVFK